MRYISRDEAFHVSQRNPRGWHKFRNHGITLQLVKPARRIPMVLPILSWAYCVAGQSCP